MNKVCYYCGRVAISKHYFLGEVICVPCMNLFKERLKEFLMNEYEQLDIKLP